MKIGVLGNCDVGKTSLTVKFTRRKNIDGVSKVKTTGIDQFNTGVTVQVSKLLEREISAAGGPENLPFSIDDTMIRLTVWDTGGQEKYNAVDSTYVRGVDGMVLVCDVTRKKTFLTIEKWCRQVVALKPMPVIIVGNKCDKESEIEVTPQMFEELSQSLHRKNIRVFLTSAVTGYNVDSAFKHMVYEVLHPVISNFRNMIMNAASDQSLRGTNKPKNMDFNV